MTNPRQGQVERALRRFYEKAAPAGRLAACAKSRNGRHWFVGYAKRTCRWCGRESAS